MVIHYINTSIYIYMYISEDILMMHEAGAIFVMLSFRLLSFTRQWIHSTAGQRASKKDLRRVWPVVLVDLFLVRHGLVGCLGWLVGCRCVIRCGGLLLS